MKLELKIINTELLLIYLFFSHVQNGKMYVWKYKTGANMKYKELIEKYVKEHDGIVESKWFKENNIFLSSLHNMVKKGILTKINRGLYVTEDSDYDDLYFLQQRCPKIIYSYKQALNPLHQCEEYSRKYSVTVYRGYKFNKDIKDQLVEIHYVNKDIYELGAITTYTPWGHPIRSYNFERTVCDFIKTTIP